MNDELEALVWRVYRRGVVHGGAIAVMAAAIWLLV
jgi:hypothetical protein